MGVILRKNTSKSNEDSPVAVHLDYRFENMKHLLIRRIVQWRGCRGQYTRRR